MSDTSFGTRIDSLGSGHDVQAVDSEEVEEAPASSMQAAIRSWDARGAGQRVAQQWSAVVVGSPGDGTLLLVDWLLLVCAEQGLSARAVPIGGGPDRPHGMYLELASSAELLHGMPGAPGPGLDLVLAGEHLELMRVLAAGWIHPDRTVVIASCQRSYTPFEQAVAVQHVLREQEIDTIVRTSARRYVAFDGPQVAGWYSLPHMVQPSLLFGALVGSDVLPCDQHLARSVIARLGIDVRAHLQGVRRGRPLGRRTGGRVQRTLTAQQFVRKRRGSLPHTEREEFEALVNRVEHTFHDSYHAQLREAVERLTDYHGSAHAARYLDTCSQVIGAADADPWAMLTFVRNLAHIMIYPDAAFAAQVKLRRTRLATIRRALGVSRDQVYHVKDVIPLEADERARGVFARVVRRQHDPAPSLLTSMPQLVVADPTTLRGILRLRRLRAGSSRRSSSDRFVREMDTADAYAECMGAVVRAAPHLAQIVAESGSLVQGAGVVRAASAATARAFWGRVVRQALAVDQGDPTRGARFSMHVVPYVWKRLVETGPLALWELSGSVVGVAMQHSRGESFDTVMHWARAICGAVVPDSRDAEEAS